MEYKYFIFDGVSSEKFNLTIMNNGEDLSFPSQANFENQVVSPLYQGTSYLAGVNKSNREFKFNCWADSLTVSKVREMLNWLSANKIGYLSLDYNPNFQYRVKLGSITDLKHFAINSTNTSNYEFSLTFTTIGEFAAKSIKTYTSTSDINPDGYPVGLTLDGGRYLYLYNFYNLPFYITFDFNTSNYLAIAKNGIPYYSYPAVGTFKIDTQYGNCTTKDPYGFDHLIEEFLPEGTPFVNMGQMVIDSNVKQVRAVVTGGLLVLDENIFTNTSTLACLSGYTQAYNNLNYQTMVSNYNLKENDEVYLIYTTPTIIEKYPINTTYSFNYRDNF